MSENLRPRIYATIAATFGIPLTAVNEHTGNDTIAEWDSMNQLHLLIALEAEFGVSFDPEHAIELVSVQLLERELLALTAR
jgi:acyl carrier protein